MALALESKYDGTIRFYREPKRAGGDLVAVFPIDPAYLPGYREALVRDPAGMGYVALSQEYVRSLRTADETDGHDMRNAERMLEQIDQRSEYVRELERTDA